MAEENENPGKRIKSALLDNLSRALQTKMKVARLQVDVVAGQGLCPKDTTGSSDPYCVCSLVDSTGRIMETNRTKTLHHTLEPRWLESFSVWRQLPSARDDWRLRIDCWNWNRFLPDNFMGRIEFILAGLDNLYQAHRSNFAGACELAPRENKHDKVSGTIKVRIQYMSENSRLVNSRQKAISEASDEFAKAKQPELNRLITDWEDLDVGLRDTLPRFKGFPFNDVAEEDLVELERGVNFYEREPYEAEHYGGRRGSGAAAAAGAARGGGSDDESDAGFGPNPAGFGQQGRPRFASEVDYDRTDLALARAGLPVPDRPAGTWQSRPGAPTERPRASSARPRLDDFFKRQNSMPQLWGDTVSSRGSLDSRYVPAQHASRRGGPPPSTSDSELSSDFNEYESSEFSVGTSLSTDPRHAPIPPPAPAPGSPPNAQHFDYAAQHRLHDQSRHRNHHSPHRHGHSRGRGHEDHSPAGGRHAHGGGLGSHGGRNPAHPPRSTGLDPHGLGSGNHQQHHEHRRQHPAHEPDHSNARGRAQSHALAHREDYGHDDGRHHHHNQHHRHPKRHHDRVQQRQRHQDGNSHAHAGFDPRSGSPLPPPPDTPPPPTQTPPPPPPPSQQQQQQQQQQQRKHSGHANYQQQSGGVAGVPFPPAPPTEPHPSDVHAAAGAVGREQDIPSGYLGSFDSGRNQQQQQQQQQPPRQPHLPPPAPPAVPPPAGARHHQHQLATFAPDNGPSPEWLVHEEQQNHSRQYRQYRGFSHPAPPPPQHPHGGYQPDSAPPSFDEPSGPPPPPPQQYSARPSRGSREHY